jgi:hypothetical protein
MKCQGAISASNHGLLQYGLALLIIISVINTSSAMIVDFKDMKVPIGKFDIRQQTMYSLDHTPVGHDVPFVDVNLTISAAKNGFATLLFYNYETRNAFGQNVVPKTFCCTKELEAANECSMGQVIVRNQTGVAPPLGRRLVAFGAEPVANVIFRYENVTATSTYYLVVANCEGSGASELLVNGRVSWRNPFGYLPGASVGMWYYYGLQALAYLLVSLVYGALMVLYRAQLLRIQYGVLGLLLLGMLQTFCWYLYELKRNRSGMQSSGTGALVMAIFFTVVKGTVTRLVVLVVCMGIGIIKWTLGSLKFPVFGLCGAYFLSSMFYEIVETIKTTSHSEVNSFANALVLFGVWICDTVFIWWALVSLIRTMGQLTLRRQTIKLTMYKRFFYIMVGCVAVWVLSLFIHFFVLATNPIEKLWRSNWLWLAFWHFSFFIIVVIVAVLWRPTRNNTRYGYSEVYYDEEEGEDERGQMASNEVQLHALGATSPVGETKARASARDDDGLATGSPKSSRNRTNDDDSTLSFSSKFDTASAFSLDDDDLMSPPKKLD